MFHIRQPRSKYLAQLSASLGGRPFTYAAVGATARDVKPSGFLHKSWSIELGAGDNVWEAAKQAMREWLPHLMSGLTLVPSKPVLKSGTSFVLTIPAVGLHVTAPARIVYVVDEANRFGFGYGTIVGHPESGEARFVLQRESDGRVLYCINSFSRPGHWLSYLGLPVTLALQEVVTRRFLRSMRSAIETSSGSSKV